MRRGVPLLALGILCSVLAVAMRQRRASHRAERAAQACAQMLDEPVAATGKSAPIPLAELVLAGPCASVDANTKRVAAKHR